MLTTNIIFPRDERCRIFMFTIRTKLVFDRLNSPTWHTLHNYISTSHFLIRPSLIQLINSNRSFSFAFCKLAFKRINKLLKLLYYSNQQHQFFFGFSFSTQKKKKKNQDFLSSLWKHILSNTIIINYFITFL